jgi:ABC-type bacteriocin/lantibiotic exporter with double-glycine peptidase domain
VIRLPLRASLLAMAWSGALASVELSVPVIPQAPERCGPAALAMVLRFYGADSTHTAAAEAAYDPALRGSLITDLAACARRAGFAARVATLTEDSLQALLQNGVPPVLLYRRGLGPVTRGHYAVVVGFEADRDRYRVHDGSPRPRAIGRRDLLRRWEAAGRQALIVERRVP